MLYLLKIDLKKLIHYRTFWIIAGLYFFTLGTAAASGMEFLKWLARTIEGFGQSININRIPLYHFPDVWQNLAWAGGLLKIMVGILVVISITNEFAYRTVRQNIIDGLSRSEFLVSKILTNLLLSLTSMVLLSLIAFSVGLIYSPGLDVRYIFNGLEFYPAYFLEVFSFLSFALMLGIFLQRSGLTIVLLLNAYLIELIIKKNIDDYVPELIRFFPLESISNLVPMPFARYAFQEIQDYISWEAVGIALVWAFLFNYFSYLKLKKSDI
ncbi:MAG: ABC transporter permease subunit [Cyclobacteriaceae bacterium]|jgi:ABC-type transport system involved in multi-copper enzyme maturation permease subunit|nr:ABC transporter permease subunit [Cyclobacteriaceae bacterium]